MFELNQIWKRKEGREAEETDLDMHWLAAGIRVQLPAKSRKHSISDFRRHSLLLVPSENETKRQ